MKIIAGILAAFLIAGSAGAVGLNTYDGTTYTTVLAPTAVAGGVSVTGSAVSVASYKGIATLVAQFAQATNTSFGAVLTVQDSTTGSGGWTNVTSATISSQGSTNAGVAAATLKLDTSTVKEYIRAVVAATNAATTASAVLAAP